MRQTTTAGMKRWLAGMKSIPAEYRRGHIEVLDSEEGLMRCRKCSGFWFAGIRLDGHYSRGSWTCCECGANSKGGFKKEVSR